MKRFRYLWMMLLPMLAVSCVDDDDDVAGADDITVSFNNQWPEGVAEEAITSAEITFRELNSGQTVTLNPIGSDLGSLPLGVYDYDGTVKLSCPAGDEAGSTIEKTLRVSGSSLTVSSPVAILLEWFYSNPGGTLVFSEIYAAGSPNATATGGLRDSYFRIYNNTSETIYADGLGIVESTFVNSRTNAFKILTPANDRQVNFTVGTVWVIPGSGTDVPILPGQSIKIADQAIDWGAQVAGALDHTDADFEWYDDNAMDTDNPSVPNLEKWYCYSNTIWIMSNQCNRSYALVRFPEGTSAESYLADWHGAFDYISIIGTQMTNNNAYLIPNSWIVDGVNLGNSESYVYGALGNSVDISFASISDIDKDANRFGRVFRRKTATVDADGVALLKDTNDSAADFERVNVR